MGALCRLVRRGDFVGLAALKAVDFRSERRIDIVRGHGGFFDAVSAVIQPVGFRSPLRVGGEQDGFANARAFGRRRRSTRRLMCEMMYETIQNTEATRIINDSEEALARPVASIRRITKP